MVRNLHFHILNDSDQGKTSTSINHHGENAAVTLNKVHYLYGLQIKDTFNLTWSCMQLRQEQIKNANYLLSAYEYKLAI